MKFVLILIIGCLEFSSSEWKSWKTNEFSIHYMAEDATVVNQYGLWTKRGLKSTELFFGRKFKSDFSVYVHPDRNSLDAQWQKDWQMPTFKSECWMVASGIATKLDLLSPRVWSTQSCEHNEADTVATQQVITHELIHVFHGQQNASPDFSAVDGIDWFVEGLATYASGQLTSAKLNGIKKALQEGTLPTTLDKFWTGKWKYGLSGSMVMFIDKTYGREKLKSLLPLATKVEILNAFQISEEKLLNDWKKFIVDSKK
jgi:hypothetical protein